jgi:Predicted phosphatases
MRYPFVFFDLDGTLTDPAQGICGSVRYALEKGGYPTAPMEAYYPWIGPPLQLSFQKHLDCDEAEAKRLVALYRERFSTVGLFENTVYPGIPPLLRLLKERGCRMAVATGKPTVFSRRILAHFDLLQYFDEVSGISLTEAPLTKQGVIERAMEQLSVTRREDCAMVGDRDLGRDRRAGLRDRAHRRPLRLRQPGGARLRGRRTHPRNGRRSGGLPPGVKE